MTHSDGTTYSYRVRAVNASGVSVNSTARQVTLVPGAPAVGAATNATANSFTANWSTSIGATGYRIDVSTSSSFSTFVSVYNNLPVTALSKAVMGLSPNITYYYRVRAENNSGVSVNSQVASKTLPPLAPVASAATDITASSFVANWNSVTGAVGYKLFVSTDINFSSYVAGYNNLPVTGTSIEVKGLSGETNYYYRLVA